MKVGYKKNVTLSAVSLQLKFFILCLSLQILKSKLSDKIIKNEKYQTNRESKSRYNDP